MSNNTKLPYCQYCERHVYHKPKDRCKQYTDEKHAEYTNRLLEKEKQDKEAAKQKAEFDEEMNRFSREYPLVAAYFQKKLDELDYELSRLRH